MGTEASRKSAPAHGLAHPRSCPLNDDGDDDIGSACSSDSHPHEAIDEVEPSRKSAPTHGLAHSGSLHYSSRCEKKLNYARNEVSRAIQKWLYQLTLVRVSFFCV